MEEVDLKGLADKGYIRFSIKAEDTPENVAVHAAFKQFAEIECDNNYTIALRSLLKNYESDYRFDALWQHIESLQEKVQLLEEKLEKPKSKDEVFG